MYQECGKNRNSSNLTSKTGISDMPLPVLTYPAVNMIPRTMLLNLPSVSNWTFNVNTTAVVADRFYIALFSALDHTRCALVECDYE